MLLLLLLLLLLQLLLLLLLLAHFSVLKFVPTNFLPDPPTPVEMDWISTGNNSGRVGNDQRILAGNPLLH